mmetsp:Transcript_10707/g.16085  ORF Transcript_10707/g.16085 Transcript_10707/m.16085 type:complete len:153 (+) Transcript_10707:3452-3910(+)
MTNSGDLMTAWTDLVLMMDHTIAVPMTPPPRTIATTVLRNIVRGEGVQSGTATTLGSMEPMLDTNIRADTMPMNVRDRFLDPSVQAIVRVHTTPTARRARARASTNIVVAPPTVVVVDTEDTEVTGVTADTADTVVDATVDMVDTEVITGAN